MAESDRPEITGRHGLGPHVVGQRVVVRRLLPGEVGPTGGPALIDVLGVCESWADGVALIRRADGTAVSIRTSQIVSGKPVPPRPSRFSRLDAEEVERNAARFFRSAEVRRIGDWLLRFSGGATLPTNSILAVGDPGMPLDAALTEATGFYAAHHRLPVAQVVTASQTQRELENRGWTRQPVESPDTVVLLTGIASLTRHFRGLDTSSVSRAEVGTEDENAVLASVHEAGSEVARGRLDLIDDWALLTDLSVDPDHRRRGLARTIAAVLNAWAAEHGAMMMLLRVKDDGIAALGFCDSLGAERHHAYRHLVPPA